MNRADYELLAKEKHRLASLLERALAGQNDLSVRAVALKIANVNVRLREAAEAKDLQK